MATVMTASINGIHATDSHDVNINIAHAWAHVVNKNRPSLYRWHHRQQIVRRSHWLFMTSCHAILARLRYQRLYI